MHEVETPLSTSRVVRTWWPLAASWVLMALEGPAMNIVVARLANPTIHLAAFGSLVFPLALLVEAPIIMLLSASTALCVDRDAYRRIRRFMHITSAVLTGLHAVVACTPLYDVLVRGLLHAPSEIVEPGRLGLLVMLPWTWSIAYRRFNQGVLIRFGHSTAVGVGTVIRLGANGLVLGLGYASGALPGTVVASAAIIAGVLSEAAYAGLRTRSVLRRELPERSATEPLTYRAFFRFYVPLSLTSLVLLGVRPVFTAAISRMPNPLDSLAVFPVVIGLVFLLRSIGVAYSEVVIAHLGQRGSTRALQRFTGVLGVTSTAAMLLLAATPLARIWFGTITGLSGPLLNLARIALWLSAFLPAMSAAQSWYQGIILQSRQTRSITEAVFVYLVATAVLLWISVAWSGTAGTYAAVVVMSVGELLRTAWMRRRSRAAWHVLRERDAISAV